MKLDVLSSHYFLRSQGVQLTSANSILNSPFNILTFIYVSPFYVITVVSKSPLVFLFADIFERVLQYVFDFPEQQQASTL